MMYIAHLALSRMSVSAFKIEIMSVKCNGIQEHVTVQLFLPSRQLNVCLMQFSHGR